LFNYLFARHTGGSFILRIEDTDFNRSTEDSARGIVEGLQWLGLDWDEGPDIGGPLGPYRQSERLPIYNKYLQQLLDEGKAYYCFCSPEEIKQQRDKAQEAKIDYKYDRTCLKLTAEQAAQRRAEGIRPVIRLKAPTDGTTTVHDLIRGEVQFDNSLVDDFIICKSDGWPTYNFAVVVDDYTMQISHVIRAEEHLSNTPKQLIIYNLLGVKPPEFAHVSMILAPDRSKLSKRHGATSVQEFRDDGYLPESLLNYLALLGWSPGGDVDFMDRKDMIGRFDLAGLSKSAAIYDLPKLEWMNGHYLAEADSRRLAALTENKFQARGWVTDKHQNYLIRVIELLKTRSKTINDLLADSEYFFTDPDTYDEKGSQKYFSGEGLNRLLTIQTIISRTDVFEAARLEAELRLKAEELGIKAAALIHPARLALTGRTSSPGLFEVMEILGRDTCLRRINHAIACLKNRPGSGRE
jgi:glutamyl-tRNA synthetase